MTVTTPTLHRRYPNGKFLADTENRGWLCVEPLEQLFYVPTRNSCQVEISTKQQKGSKLVYIAMGWVNRPIWSLEKPSFWMRFLGKFHTVANSNWEVFLDPSEQFLSENFKLSTFNPLQLWIKLLYV